MLKEELKNALTESLSGYNVDGLICFMESVNVEYVMAELRGPLAMATFESVFIDIKQIKNKSRIGDGKLLYFIILHETAHIKRMKKLGKTEILRNLSLDVFDKFFEHIIFEEMIADRYGSYIYQKLNNSQFPSYMTQQLNFDFNVELYKQTARLIFGRIQNDEKKYKELFEQFIIKKY
jgi:hypothetical protein